MTWLLLMSLSLHLLTCGLLAWLVIQQDSRHRATLAPPSPPPPTPPPMLDDLAPVGSFLPTDQEQAAMQSRLDTDSRQRAGVLAPSKRSSKKTKASPMAASP